MRTNKGTHFCWFWFLCVDGILTWKCAGECLVVISLIATMLILQTKIQTSILERNSVEMGMNWMKNTFVCMNGPIHKSKVSLESRSRLDQVCGISPVICRGTGTQWKQKQFLLYCAWKSIQISRRVCFISTLLNVVLLILIPIVCVCLFSECIFVSLL